MKVDWVQIPFNKSRVNKREGETGKQGVGGQESGN